MEGRSGQKGIVERCTQATAVFPARVEGAPSRIVDNVLALDAGLRDSGLPAPTPAVEVAADLNTLITLDLHMDLLIVVARMALEIHVSARELRILDVADLRLPPIQVGFLTLTEYEDIEPLRNLKQTLTEVVAE